MYSRRLWYCVVQFGCLHRDNSLIVSTGLREVSGGEMYFLLQVKSDTFRFSQTHNVLICELSAVCVCVCACVRVCVHVLNLFRIDK